MKKMKRNLFIDESNKLSVKLLMDEDDDEDDEEEEEIYVCL